MSMTNMQKRKQLKKIRRTKLITKKYNIEKMMMGMKRKFDRMKRFSSVNLPERLVKEDTPRRYELEYKDEQESTT